MKQITLMEYTKIHRIILEDEAPFEFENQLLLGDCLEILPNIPDSIVNTVLTDPPFFVPIEHYSSRQHWQKKYADLSVMKGFFAQVFREFKRVLVWNGHLLVFCDPVSYPLFFQPAYSLFDITRCLVWYKGKNYFSLGKDAWRHSFELILHSRNSNAYFLRLDRQDIIENPVVPNQERVHPAQKPIGLLKKLITACTPKKGLVLDAFAGSGSTIVAAKELAFRYVGIEMDKTYFEIAKNRVERARSIEQIELTVNGG